MPGAAIVGASCLLAEAAGYGLDPQVSLQHQELEAWLSPFDGPATLVDGDIQSIREEIAEPGHLLFDDDPFFATAHESTDSADQSRTDIRQPVASKRVSTPTSTPFASSKASD